MKKLLINALLVLGFAAAILGLVLGLSKLRAVDNSEAAVETMLETESQEEAYAAKKEIFEQSQVTVTVTSTQETPSQSSDDALVKGFLERVE